MDQAKHEVVIVEPQSRTRLALSSMLAAIGGVVIAPFRREPKEQPKLIHNPRGEGRRTWNDIGYSGRRNRYHFVDQHGQHWSNGQPIRKAERKGINTVPRAPVSSLHAISFSR